MSHRTARLCRDRDLVRLAEPEPAGRCLAPCGEAPESVGSLVTVGVAECLVQPDCTADVRTTPQAGTVPQLKVKLPGISPVIWRRILVHETMSLREFHGTPQVTASGFQGVVEIVRTTIAPPAHVDRHHCWWQGMQVFVANR